MKLNITDSAQEGLNSTNLKEIKIHLPPAINSSDLAKTHLSIPTLPEQRKVADCLSSIDNLITAQAQKIDALKAHKKGLMQQLFSHR